MAAAASTRGMVVEWYQKKVMLVVVVVVTSKLSATMTKRKEKDGCFRSNSLKTNKWRSAVFIILALLESFSTIVIGPFYIIRKHSMGMKVSKAISMHISVGLGKSNCNWTCHMPRVIALPLLFIILHMRYICGELWRRVVAQAETTVYMTDVVYTSHYALSGTRRSRVKGID